MTVRLVTPAEAPLTITWHGLELHLQHQTGNAWDYRPAGADREAYPRVTWLPGNPHQRWPSRWSACWSKDAFNRKGIALSPTAACEVADFQAQAMGESDP